MTSPSAIVAAKIGRKIINELMAVKSGEEVLIIVDPATPMEVAYALAASAEAASAEYTIAMMPAREMGPDYQKLPQAVVNAITASDVVIGITQTTGAPTYDATVTRLLKEKKIRYMSMVRRSLENWTEGAATADYEQVYATAEKLAAIMGKTDVFRVTTALGTDLTVSTKDRRAIIEAGLARQPGQSAAFSDGEVSKGVIEGSADGVIVVDGPIALVGQPGRPMKLVVGKSRVVGMEGDVVAEKLKGIISSVKYGDHIAEIGIGVNPKSRRGSDFQEEKKGLGNIHIALGDDIYYGGAAKSPVHIDMVVYDCDVLADGKPLLEKGSWWCSLPLAVK